MSRYHPIVVLGLAAVCVFRVAGAEGAALSIGTPSAIEDVYAVSVFLTPGSGENVAGLQFNFQFSASQFSVTDVSAGTAAAAANKDVAFSQEGDTLRVIVAGLNQEVMETGEVVVVYLAPKDAGATLDSLQLENAVFADPEGQSVPQSAAAGSEGESSSSQSTLTSLVSSSPGATSTTSATSSSSAKSTAASTAENSAASAASSYGGVSSGYEGTEEGVTGRKTGSVTESGGVGRENPSRSPVGRYGFPPLNGADTPSQAHETSESSGLHSTAGNRAARIARTLDRGAPSENGDIVSDTPGVTTSTGGKRVAGARKTASLPFPGNAPAAMALPSQRHDPLAPAIERDGWVAERVVQGLTVVVGLGGAAVLSGAFWFLKRRTAPRRHGRRRN